MELEAIVDAAHAKDPKERLRAIQEAGDFVAADGASVDSAPLLVDALQPALRDNNPKVVQGALELLLTLASELQDGFAPFTSGLWGPLGERMGDAKTHMRERAVDLAVGLATLCVPAVEALERLRRTPIPSPSALRVRMQRACRPHYSAAPGLQACL
jgi:hypothetical protein